MLRNHYIVFAAVLFASLQTAIAAEPGEVRDTGIGRLIAEQGNRALSQIRGDLRDALHGLRPRVESEPGLTVPAAWPGPMVSETTRERKAGV